MADLLITVRDLETGFVVSGATVALTGGSSQTTDAAGQTTFTGLAADALRYWYAWKTDYLVSWDAGVPASGGTTWLTPDTYAGDVPFCYADPLCPGGPQADPGCYPAITGIHLAEDTDGIEPHAGTKTYDQTPTLAWTCAGGTPPYLYLWELRSANGVTVLYSGSTSSPLATMPELPYSVYHFRVHANDARGRCSLWDDWEFEVEQFIPDVDVDPDPDIEPIDPLPPNHIRYLPQWLSIFGTQTEAGSGTLLWQFFEPQLVEWARMHEGQQNVVDRSALLQVPAGQARLAWHLHTRLNPRDPFVVTVRLGGSGSVLTGEVRRAVSEYDWLTAFDSVYLIGEDGQMVFRNLPSRSRTLSLDGSGIYPFTGETDGLVRDADVTFQYGGVWYLLPADASGLDAITGRAQLPGGFTGSILFRYLSRLYQDDLEVKVGGEPYQAPHRFDLWNRFDEIALLAGLRRRADEDNRAFRNRIRARFLSQVGTVESAVAQHVAEDLNLVDVLPWDGVSTLSLAASGYWGVRTVYVRGIPETGSSREELLPVGDDGLFTASRREWLPGWDLSVDGQAATRFTYPDLAVTGDVVDFGEAVEGRAWARFRYPNYELTRSSAGAVTTVTPVSGNLAPGDYEVLLVRGVRLHVVDSLDFITEELLDAAGRPNAYFRQVREAILQGSPVHLGRTGWRQGYWLNSDEDRPQVAYLPLVYDETLA
jgi:hypothetical protein